MNHRNIFSCGSISAISLLFTIACGDEGSGDTTPGFGGAGGSGAAVGSGGASGAGAAGGAGGSAATPGTGGSGAGTGGGSGSAGTGGVAGSAGTGGGSGSAGTGGAVGSGGASGSGGSAGVAGTGGSGGKTFACNTALTSAGKCNPEIQFQNEQASGPGRMFDQVIPDPVTTMKSVACQVCTILYRAPSEITRNPAMIRLRIYDFDGVANAGGGTINFSSRHIANYTNPSDALFEYLGVLIHETTHLYQFNQGGGGLVEGMADFVRIRAGHHRMSRRVRGGAWTDPYTTSGFFFSWLAGPGGLQTDGRTPADPDIGWAINQQMRTSWSEQVFVTRLGQNVNTLWTEYQNAL